jgi:hypothetical protein
MHNLGFEQTAMTVGTANLSLLLREVCSLQVSHSDTNTSGMARRGSLIRDEIPDKLRPHILEIGMRAHISANDLLLRGKDGAGRKSHVPWVRIASKMRSPSPTHGWYVVYLWRRDGSGVYLALAHGSTEYRDGSFVPRPSAELQAHVSWAKEILSQSDGHHPTSSIAVDLRSHAPLARAYERSCPAARFYLATHIPPDDELLTDLGDMMHLLGLIYEQERLGRSPYSENPEIRDAITEAAAIASPLAANGQGPGLSAAERKAVEVHAMKTAQRHLEQLGYFVKNCSAKESYDLLASRNCEELTIEVKGTTGSADKILLTANEVELHLVNRDRNGLIVVYDVELTRGPRPFASGGRLLSHIPWRLERSQLRAISYSCRLPREI